MSHSLVDFHQVGNTIEAGTSGGINIFKSYMSVNHDESSQLPKINGAEGFDAEADSLILVFQSEEAARAGLLLLSGLV